MRDVTIHLAEAGAFVEIFTSDMRMSIEVMDQPRGSKDPVFKALVVIAILGIGCQHPIINGAAQAGPLGGFRGFVVKRIGGHRKSGNRYKSMVLTVGERATRLWLEILSQQARLNN